MLVGQASDRLFLNGQTLAYLRPRPRPDATSTWLTQRWTVPAGLLQPGANRLSLVAGPRNPARQHVDAQDEPVDDRKGGQQRHRDPSRDAAEDTCCDADRGAREQNARRESGSGRHLPSVLTRAGAILIESLLSENLLRVRFESVVRRRSRTTTLLHHLRKGPRMGRSSRRAVAVVTLAALFTGTASAGFAATPECPRQTARRSGHHP